MAAPAVFHVAFNSAGMSSFLFLVSSFRAANAGAVGPSFSLQYPLVEFFTGALFLGVFLKFLPIITNNLQQITNNLQLTTHNATSISPSVVSCLLSVVFYLVIFSLLMVIFVYDLRHKIIPNGPVYAFAILALARVVIIFLAGSVCRPNISGH